MNQKHDAGKAPMWRGLMCYFPRALRWVARVSQFGNDKYHEWGGWTKVEDAQRRYADALGRHLAHYAAGETLDPESGLPHLAHAAWNALAILELASRTNLEEPEVAPVPVPPTGPALGAVDVHRHGSAAWEYPAEPPEPATARGAAS